ncbi:MAG: sulfurtransferase TusA family protein [Halodesulfurarchaeum sp.]
MNVEFDVSRTLDVTGHNCPIPVVKTKQEIDDVESGGVLEVTATDQGSVSDIDGWASSTTGVKLLEQVEEDDGGDTLYKHYVRKTE